MSQPTKRMIAFLRWAQSQGEFTLWPMEWAAMLSRASKAGLIERRPRGGASQLTKWGLSQSGKDLLA